MAKTLEQIVIEGLASDCSSLEELYVLWQTMHHTEADTVGKTCHMEIDKRSFHIDGPESGEIFRGALHFKRTQPEALYSERTYISGDHGYPQGISEI